MTYRPVPQEVICPTVYSIGGNYGCGGRSGLGLVVGHEFALCHRADNQHLIWHAKM